tara:strand:+ start:727 stop:1128 length:402 start_codon:yes stop_codon:yes gene_type:complete
MKREKYLYFRAQATLASDTGADDSAVFKASNFAGMHPKNDNEISIYFKSMCNADGDAHTTAGGDEVIRCDRVDMRLSAANTHKRFMERFTMVMQTYKDGMVVIGDNKTGATELFSTYATSVMGIDIDATNVAG